MNEYAVNIGNKWVFYGTVDELLVKENLSDDCLCGKVLLQLLKCDMDMLYPNLEPLN